MGLVILPAHLNIFREQAENGEETGKGAATTDFIQKLIAIQLVVVPRSLLDLRSVARLGIHLNRSFYHTVEALVLIQ